MYRADRKHSQIEFGAHQVLLCRTQEAKDSLPSFLEGCLAMTILESKGLEFDDVFIWNFLSDSRCQKEWRLVLSYLVERDASEKDNLDQAAATADNKEVAGVLRTLDFNEHSHAALCSELKHLYTAITRARVRVVIYDEDAASRAPLFYYLTRRGLCDTVSVLGQTSAQGFAVETSAGSGSPVNPDIRQCTGISDLPGHRVSWLPDACVCARATCRGLENAGQEFAATRVKWCSVVVCVKSALPYGSASAGGW
jgi:hypothetical protein